MDEEEARAILIDWLHKVAAMLRNGLLAVGGEIASDLTGRSGHAYRMEIASRRGADGLAVLSGRIRPKALEGPVISVDARLDF